jgi:hypothetical protein
VAVEAVKVVAQAVITEQVVLAVVVEEREMWQTKGMFMVVQVVVV